jgi:hypothetical protein
MSGWPVNPSIFRDDGCMTHLDHVFNSYRSIEKDDGKRCNYQSSLLHYEVLRTRKLVQEDLVSNIALASSRDVTCTVALNIRHF